MSISQSTPPPHLNNPSTQLVRCVVCQTEGPLGKVLKCQQCHFRVHVGEPIILRVFDTGAMSVSTGACGAVVNSPESWKCEICENEDTLEAAIVKKSHPFLFPLQFLNCNDSRPQTAFCVLAPRGTRRNQTAHIRSIHTCTPASRQRGKDGRTFSARCSFPS